MHIPVNEFLKAPMQRLAEIRHVALDMDGTIYLGNQLLKESRPFLDRMKELGIGCTFLTNNSSKSRTEYVEHLTRIGIPATRESVFTSTNALIELLAPKPPGSLFVVGTTGLCRELSDAGFDVLPSNSDLQPGAVIVGYDPHLDYQTLCKAAWWIKKGLPYFATHPDRTCPTNEEKVLLDCGALCAALKAAVGRKPDVVAGKPEPQMLDALCSRLGITSREVAMVGDRLYTDVLMASRAGAFGILTLTGETRRSRLAASEIQPDLVIENLAELAELLASAKNI